MRARSTLLLVPLLLAPALAGCFSADSDAHVELARPRVGDTAEYAVEGHLVEFARWANGVPLQTADARLRFTLADAEGAVDGFGAYHPALRLVTEVKDGAAFRVHRASLVSPEHAAVVQSFVPIGTNDRVVAFDERGYPWAWGASRLHGEALEEGRAYEATLPANAGQDAAIPLVLEVVGRERVGDVDAWRVDVTGVPDDVTWRLWLDPDVPFPVAVEVAMPADAMRHHVRASSEGDLAFRATLTDFTRGDTPVPPRDSGRAWLDTPVAAVFEPWDREKPPEGEGAYVPFRLGEAIAWARTVDSGFREWDAANPDAILYRATYMERAGPVDGSRGHVWLFAFVSPENQYYEVQVERVRTNATAALPVPTGVMRVLESGPADPPRGAHGWFPPDALPDRLLTLASGVHVMRTFFPPDGVEIFLRSFDDPVGYAYYIDGGFEREMGRYTVIVNAQTGFVQAAVGPVEPLTAPLAPVR